MDVCNSLNEIVNIGALRLSKSIMNKSQTISRHQEICRGNSHIDRLVSHEVLFLHQCLGIFIQILSCVDLSGDYK